LGETEFECIGILKTEWGPSSHVAKMSVVGKKVKKCKAISGQALRILEY
jgi:hypothetical protein